MQGMGMLLKETPAGSGAKMIVCKVKAHMDLKLDKMEEMVGNEEADTRAKQAV